MELTAAAPVPRRQAMHLLKAGFAAFMEDNALTRGAAIAFYAITAIVPVLFIATSIAGFILGRYAASGAVGAALRHIMSRPSADLVQGAILHARDGKHTFLGGFIGIAALVVTASGVFTEIEDALNVIWKAPRTESYLYQLLRGRVMSLILVIGLGFLLVFSMIVASGIGLIGRLLARTTSFSTIVIDIFNFAFSFVIVSLLFAAIYKLLPNKPLYWRDVIAGACGTALLFEAGQSFLSFYLANFITANIYGAAGGVIVLVVWVYYIAQIFLFGAEITKVWALQHSARRDRFTA